MAITDDPRVLNDAKPRSLATAGQERCSRGERRGLLLVGLYKLLEAAFFVAVGAGALKLMHKDLGDVLMRVVNALPMDPEGRVVSFLMDKVDLINAHDLRRIGAGSFLYAVTRIVEGTGLILRKAWAEYFTVTLTALGVPIEVYELIRNVNWFKVGVLVLNVAILVYLVMVLQRHRKVHDTEPGAL